LLGVWDDDDNWLFDPSDSWGAYITEVDVDGNPITIEDADLPEHDIQIPLDDGDSPFALVPFISISGDVTALGGGSISDLFVEEGATIHIAALKYRPNQEVELADVIADAYDTDTLQWEDFEGQSAVAYEVSAPANSIVYLWAYGDSDDDGTLNEHGDPVASGGTNTSGKLPTGEEDITGRDLEMNVVGE